MLSDNLETLKYIDFGLSRETDSESSLQSTTVGTARYKAPEIYFGRGKRFTQKVDIWYDFFLIIL